MKTVKFTLIIIVFLAYIGMNQAIGQWNASGNNIYNTNSGNVGIGNNAPTSLLHVGKNMTEPTITIQNLGGIGGATYSLIDNASGANWKFKATFTGGFKIRDHANLLDVFVIEPNSAANALYIKAGGNVGMGTTSPATSAAVDISATDKGLLIPRLTLSQIQSISAPADGLQVYCTTYGKIYIFVDGAQGWKEVAYGSGTIAPPFTCGTSFTVDHVAGPVAPVIKVVTYNTVTGIPGEASKCWITSNLGASHQATAKDDATEASAGWYWQFNLMQGYKHDGATRTPNTTWIISILENSNWISANDPCTIELGIGWRLPTNTEWLNVDATGGWNSWNGPWDSALKLHAAGYLAYFNGSLYDRGASGSCWSSSQGSTSTGLNLYFNSGNCYLNNTNKAHGFSARCLKD